MLNRTKRRRILQALLPLLAFVWAVLPALACCHLNGTAPVEETLVAADAIDHGHERGNHHDAGVMDGFTIDHGENHCEEGTVSVADAPCLDVQKTSSDVRPIQFVAALIVASYLLPSPEVVSLRDAPVPDPSPPPRHRPLHLEKSVLLI